VELREQGVVQLGHGQSSSGFETVYDLLTDQFVAVSVQVVVAAGNC